MHDYTFGKMTDTLIWLDPNAVFEWRGNRIVNQNGAIVDESTGKPIECDRYTMSYMYKKVQ